MKKIFSFLCLIAAIVVAMSACSSTKEEKGTSETGNAALDNIFARKSVRTYLNKGVEKEKIDLMLRAGMAAPSGKDIRPWEFIVVSDRAKLDSMAAALPYAKMLTQARNAIIVCGDSVRSSYWYLDCSAAAQNILLAAESLGLGAVWTAAYPYEDRMQVQMAALKDKLEKISGKTVTLTQKTDPTVLAGLKVELEGRQLDGTVKSRLDDLSRKLNELIV